MRLLLATGLLVATGCQPRTEIMLGLVTDLLAPSSLRLVHIDVLRDGVPVHQLDWDIPGGRTERFALPGSYGVYSPSGDPVKVEVVLSGYRDANLQNKVVERKSLFTLVQGKTLFLRMGLVAGCMNNFGCPSGTTCIEGACKDKVVDTSTLPAFRTELVSHVTCNSGTQYINTEDNTPMPALGNMQCAGPCQEGTCYNPPAGNAGVMDGGLMPLWEQLEVPPMAQARPINAVWATNNGGYHVFTVGDGGLILHLTAGPPGAASQFVDESVGIPERLNAVFGTGPDDVWAVGDNSRIFHRTKGAWTPVTLPGGMQVVLHAGFALSPAQAAAAGRSPAGQGMVLTWDGLRWTVDSGFSTAAPTAADIKGIAGVAPNLLVTVGLGGEGWVLNGGWMRLPFPRGGEPPDYAAVWIDPETRDGYGVGRLVGGGPGLIVHGAQNLMDLSFDTLPTREPLTGVWGTSLGNVYAVGENGLILHSSGDGNWVPQPSMTTTHIRGIFGLNDKDIYAVGEQGLILHSTGGAAGGTGPATDGGAQLPDGGTSGACGPINCIPGDPGCTCSQNCAGAEFTDVREMRCDASDCICFINGGETRRFRQIVQVCTDPVKAFQTDCGFGGPQP